MASHLMKKRKVSMVFQYLPEEMLTEILIRLPTKSLLRFTSVCKSWQSLITDSRFISLHHKHSSSSVLLQHVNYHLHPNPDGRLRQLSKPCSIRPFLSAGASDSSLPLPFSDDSSILAICDGLICLTRDNKGTSLVICNPSLRRYLSLPVPNDIDPSLSVSPTLVRCGFGFDSRNHDYKLIRIEFNKISAKERLLHISFPDIQVYSHASGFWRNLRPNNLAPFCITSYNWTHNGHGGLVKGFVHWGARRRVGKEENHAWHLFVLSFDFQEEVFHEIMLPKCIAHASHPMAMVTVVGGGNVDNVDLTVYHVNDDAQCSGSIWVMKEYGVVESWNKVFAYDLINNSCLRASSLGMTITTNYQFFPLEALCITNNGEILLMLTNSHGKERLYLLDQKKKSLEDLGIQFWGEEEEEEYTWRYLYVGYYNESLVFLNKNVCAGALMSY